MIYAIGDSHGCAVELKALLGKIAPVAGDTVMFLGDYIDRGPDSKGVVDIVRGYQPESVTVVALKGNHEDMMVQVHANPGLWSWWIENGGAATLESYGGNIPPDVLSWAKDLPTSYRSGRYFFCHAGVYPGVSLAEQEDEHLLWIRARFLLSKEDHGAIVVHGHTPEDRPVVRTNRIGVDTGCCYGDGWSLTCAVLGDGRPTFIRQSAMKAA